MNLETPLTIRSMIEPVIKRNGGWVNTHAHADRSFTLSPDVLHMRKTCTLQQKWDALDKLKSESTEEDFYRRFCQFFELMISQGVTAVGTFVDIDPQSRDRATKPAFEQESITQTSWLLNSLTRRSRVLSILRPDNGSISAPKWSTS